MKRQGHTSAPNGKPRFASRLTRPLLAKIVEQLEQGAPLAAAAAVAGVPRRTFFDWLAAGRALIDQPAGPGKLTNGDALRVELAESVQMALDRCQADGATSLWNDGDWRARLALLERRFADDWAPVKRVDVGNAGGQPFRVDAASLAGLPDEKLAALERALLDVRELLVGETLDVEDAEVLELEAGE